MCGCHSNGVTQPSALVPLLCVRAQLLESDCYRGSGKLASNAQNLQTGRGGHGSGQKHDVLC